MMKSGHESYLIFFLHYIIMCTPARIGKSINITTYITNDTHVCLLMHELSAYL